VEQQPADVGPLVDSVDDPFVGRLVDFRATARRMRRSAAVLLLAALGAWLITGLGNGGLAGSDLGGWLGLALGGMFVVEVVVVGGSALRGMLRAGESGERLAAGDVGILPPQLRRRLRP
jgi:hypothetical protein